MNKVIYRVDIGKAVIACKWTAQYIPGSGLEKTGRAVRSPRPLVWSHQTLSYQVLPVMLTDSKVCISPLSSDLSFLFSPPSLCFEPSDSQRLAVIWGYNMLSPVEIRSCNSKGDHSRPLTLLPPILLLPSIFVSMELNSQVEKWEQAKSIAIHRPPRSPRAPLQKRERKKDE